MNGRNVQWMVRTLAIAGAGVAVLAALASAQIVSGVDPSARAGGMGGATGAIGWGGTPDLWANPALAATVPGFSIQTSAQQLLPEFASDLRLHSTSITATFAGLSFSSTGRPFGGTELRERDAILTLDTLRSIAVVPWAERSESRAAAISLASLADAVLALRGGAHPRVSEWADVGFGRRWKQRAQYGPFLTEGASASRDEGWYARVVPLDPRRGVDVPEGGLRLELAVAHAVIDARTSPAIPATAVAPLQRRDGAALHASWFGPSRRGAPGAAITDAFRGGGFGPPVDVTLAYERERDEPLPGRGPFGEVFPAGAGWTVNHYGLEATFFGLLTGRAGYIDDPSGEIRKPTFGFGACLPLGRGGEVRYDMGSVPQASGLEKRVTRHEVAVRLDPVARWFGPRSSAATP